MFFILLQLILSENPAIKDIDVKIFSDGAQKYMTQDENRGGNVVGTTKNEDMAEIFHLHANPRTNDLIISEDSNKNRNIVLDISNDESQRLLTYPKHGGDNQRFDLKMAANGDTRITQDERCLTFNRDRGEFILDRSRCLNLGDEGYINQLFKIKNIDDPDENKSDLAHESDGVQRIPSNDGKQGVNDSEDEGPHEHNHEIGDAHECFAVTGLQATNCRECQRIENIRNKKGLRASGLVSNRNNSALRDKEHFGFGASSRNDNDRPNKSIRKHETGKHDELSAKYYKNSHSRLQKDDEKCESYNRNKRYIDGILDSESKDKSNSNAKDVIDSSRANNKDNKYSSGVGDNSDCPLSGCGNNCSQSDPLNPICTEEITQKINEISKNIPISLNV